MAYTKLGRIRPVYSGEWKSDKAYTALEIVRSAGNGLAYIAQKDVPAKTPLTNSAYWAVVLDVREVLEAAENATSRINTIMDIKANALVASITGNPARLFPDENSILKPVSALEPIQSGSDDPYPAGGGKNLINSIYAGATKNGVEITRNDDGSYTLNGTCAAAGVVIISRLTLDAGTYTLSYKVLDGSVPDSEFSVAQLRHGDTEAAMNYVSTTTRKTASHTLTERTNVMVRLLLADGVTYNNWRVGVQLEKGSAATEYTPSVNLRPIIGHTKASLTRCGKNLYDLNSAGTFSTNKVEINGSAIRLYTMQAAVYASTTGNTIRLKAGVRYALSGKVTAVGIQPGWARLCMRRKASSQIISATSIDLAAGVGNYSRTFVLNEDVDVYVSILVTGSTAEMGDMTLADIMLEEGSTVSQYEPYQGGGFSLNFGQTVYGGTLDWNTGELAVDWACKVLDGTETGWIASNAAAYRYYWLDIAGYGEVVEGSAAQICSHYPWGMLESGNNMTNVFRIYSTTTTNKSRFLCRPNHDGIADVASWKAYLAAQKAAGTPVQIAYRLKNPTVLQLTPVQILALKGVNTLYGDSDEMTVNYNRDLANAYEELRNAIIAMGGNV